MYIIILLIAMVMLMAGCDQEQVVWLPPIIYASNGTTTVVSSASYMNDTLYYITDTINDDVAIFNFTSATPEPFYSGVFPT